jgi:hypothetical protein
MRNVKEPTTETQPGIGVEGLNLDASDFLIAFLKSTESPSQPQRLRLLTHLIPDHMSIEFLYSQLHL